MSGFNSERSDSVVLTTLNPPLWVIVQKCHQDHMYSHGRHNDQAGQGFPIEHLGSSPLFRIFPILLIILIIERKWLFSKVLNFLLLCVTMTLKIWYYRWEAATRAALLGIPPSGTTSPHPLVPLPSDEEAPTQWLKAVRHVPTGDCGIIVWVETNHFLKNKIE